MDEKLIELYKQLNNVLHLRDGWLGFIIDFFRIIGSGLIAFLGYINNIAENLVEKFLTLNNFYASSEIKTFMTDARPFIWGLFLLAVIILGYQIMFNKIQKRNEVVINILLSICFLVIIPDLMVNLGDITNKAIKTLNPSNESLSSELIKSNVLDISYYADKNFVFSEVKDGSETLPPRPRMKTDTGSGKSGTDNFTYANKLSKSTIPYINYKDTIDVEMAKEFSGETAQKLLSNKLVLDGDSFKVKELKDNDIPMTSLGAESYYRWHVNWASLIFSLLVVGIALVISLIKIGRLIFDLGFHQIFGTFVAVTDLSGGQRTKKVLAEIINSFAVLYLIVLLLKLFIWFSQWATNLKGSIGTWGVLILLIAGAWAIIDAPDVVQRILGIDAGLRSGWATMMGTYAAAKTGMAGLKGVTKAAGGLARGSVSGLSFGKGMLAGMKNPSSSGEINKIPSNSNNGSSGKEENKIPSNSNSGSSGKGENKIPGNSNYNSSGKGENKIPSNSNNGSLDEGKNKIPNNSKGGSLEGSTNERNIEKVPNSSGNAIPSQNGDNPSKIKKENASLSSEGNKNQPIPKEKSSAGSNEFGNKPDIGKVQNEEIPLSSSSNGFISSNNSLPNESQGIGERIPNSSPIDNSNDGQSIISGEYKGENGYYNKPGMKEAKHYNTTGGKVLRNMKESSVQARNSGYRLGQNIRRAAVPISNTTKKVLNSTTKTLRDKNIDKKDTLTEHNKNGTKDTPVRKSLKHNNIDKRDDL